MKRGMVTDSHPLAPTGVAVIGCGYWGVNHVRVFSEMPDAALRAACDASPIRLREISARYPSITVTDDLEEVLARDDIEGVVVATGAHVHFDVAARALRAGKHVLVEKPLTTSSDHAEELIALSEETQRLLVVGHTFLYNPAVRKVKEHISSEDFGELHYLYARRTNLGPIRYDVNAVWDLASHDVSIFNYLLDATPTWVSAVGARCLRNGREDVGFVSLGYPGGTVAHVHVSWAEPNKVREVVVVGSDNRVVFNDVDPLEPVRVFFKGVRAVPGEEPTSYGEHRLHLRDGDILSPAIPFTEPLKHECGHFLHCIRRGERPFTTAYDGRDVVRVMEAIDESIRRRGTPVTVGTNGATREEGHSRRAKQGRVASPVC
jgi:predicted dehydrogenase